MKTSTTANMKQQKKQKTTNTTTSTSTRMMTVSTAHRTTSGSNIHRHRNNDNTKSTTKATAKTAAVMTAHKIQIRPYQTIPQLPKDYYPINSRNILSYCHFHLQQQFEAAASLLSSLSSSSSSPFDNENHGVMNRNIGVKSTQHHHHHQQQQQQLSNQRCYTMIMDFVRHSFGTLFYSDLIYNNIIPICIQLLPAFQTVTIHRDNTSNNNNNNNNNKSNTNDIQLLIYIIQKYKLYIQYITKVIQPICLPIDQTYVWEWNAMDRKDDHNNNNNSEDCPMKDVTDFTDTDPSSSSTTTKSDLEFIASLRGGKAIPIHSLVSTTTTTTTTSSTTTGTTATETSTDSSRNKNNTRTTSNPTTTNDIWDVCITIFIKRLQHLQYIDQIYHVWIYNFLMDWNHGSIGGDKNLNSDSFGTIKKSDGGDNTNIRYILKEIWFMWYDLHLLSSLTIQKDIYDYWYNVCYTEWLQQEQQQPSSLTGTLDLENAVTTTKTQQYSITKFVLFCHERLQFITKHLQYIHQTNYGSNGNLVPLFSPSTSSPSIAAATTTTTWLYHIFDISFMIHHFNDEQYVFNDKYFFPLLHDHLFTKNLINPYEQQPAANTTSTNTTTKASLNIIQQLWILAGRIPNGHNKMNLAIQRYAKDEGYRCISRNTSASVATIASTIITSSPPLDTTVTGAITPSTANHGNNVIEDLLGLQNALHQLVQQLSVVTPKTKSNANTSVSATIQNLLKSVWEEIINVEFVYSPTSSTTTTTSIAEQLAKFLDITLRSTKKMDALARQQQQQQVVMNVTSTTPTNSGSVNVGGIATTSSSADDYRWLQRIIHGIFVPLQAKDIFEAFYKRDLAKRLLWNRIVNMDIEKYVCSLLKAECGTGYTSKIEGMFQDVDWSRETMLLYKQQQSVPSAASDTTVSGHDSSVEVEVQVLTTGYWPVYPIYPNLILPEALIQQQEQFATYYHNKHQGRRMVWQYALGHCVVRVNGYNKPYELLVSLCQALVLIQFTKDTTSLSLPQLLQATGLEDRNEMERILQSLALGKDGTRILRKIEHTSEPGKKTKILMTIDDRDTFMINTKFESKVRRIRITNVMMKETKEEREKTVETVSRDRLYLIDAVLVRIMKARKTILHQALIPQVLEQVKVPAQAADVKKRIESLIEREYMERDTDDRNRYNYLA